MDPPPTHQKEISLTLSVPSRIFFYFVTPPHSTLTARVCVWPVSWPAADDECLRSAVVCPSRRTGMSVCCLACCLLLFFQ